MDYFQFFLLLRYLYMFLSVYTNLFLRYALKKEFLNKMIHTVDTIPHIPAKICTGVFCICHLEPDILECEVKWPLGSITMNKASGGDGIPVELFQILKDDAVKCCTQYASKFGKLISGHRTGKGQFSFQSQRKAMPKNAQTTAQLHLSHTWAK